MYQSVLKNPDIVIRWMGWWLVRFREIPHLQTLKIIILLLIVSVWSCVTFWFSFVLAHSRFRYCNFRPFNTINNDYNLCHTSESTSLLQTLTCSVCYKTFFRGSLDFRKIKKLKKVCTDVWTCTTMFKQCSYFKQNYTLKLLISFQMAYSCCFS